MEQHANQRTNQLINKKRLRREYLWQKCESYFYLIIFAGLIIVTTGCLVNNAILYSQQGYRSYIILMVLLGLGVIVHINTIRRVHRTLKTLPYVPPVAAVDLPAEEVLVRSSDEPPLMQRDVLLRSAQGQAKKEETTGEELLHVTV